MDSSFLSKLNSYVDASYNNRQEVADELNHAYNSKNKTSGVLHYSRSKVSKELNGIKLISKSDLPYWAAALGIDSAQFQELELQYAFYEFQFHLPQEQIHKIEKIHALFSVAQQLSLPRAKYHYRHYEPYPDGIIQDMNRTQIAVQQELIREFQNNAPKIDLFLPQHIPYYYTQIKHLLSGVYDEKNIVIRQILMFSDSKKACKSGEFDLIGFIGDLFYLYYANPGCYHFYYSYSDCLVSDINGLIFPYYICTSDCLIRISQHGTTAWISHNPQNVAIYRAMFETRLMLPTTKPFSCKFQTLEALFQFFLSPDSGFPLSAVISPQPCFFYYAGEVQALRSVINPSWVMPDRLKDESAADLIVEYASIFEQKKETATVRPIDFCTLEGLCLFAETGKILAYPEGLLYPFPVQDRIRILKQYENDMSADSAQAVHYILKREVFNSNNTFVICVSEKSVISYPLGMKNFDIFLVKEPKFVSDVRFFFLDYLSKSELVYSPKEALKIVRELIEKLASE